MKRFTLIVAVVVCLSTVVNAALARVEFSGYITARDTSLATIEYLGVSPGEEFRLAMTYDLDTFYDTGTTRQTKEFGYSLSVGNDSGSEIIPDFPYVSRFESDQHYTTSGPILMAWSWLDATDGTSHIVQRYALHFDLFALDGEVGQELDGAGGRITYKVIDYATGEVYGFHGAITKGTILSSPNVVAVPAPGAMLLAGFGASIVGWFRKRRLIA